MNITNKFQHTPIQGQPQSNLQAQQILLLQLHQGQAQQQQQQQQQQQSSAGVLGSGFQPSDNFGESLNQNIYQNNYQRAQPSLQQQFFPQFQQSQQQPSQQANNALQLQQPYQPAQQMVRQTSHFQQQQQQQPSLQQFYSQQQASVLQQQQQQQIQLQSAHQQQLSLLNMNSINVDNPNSVYWQHQQQLCQISRGSNVPHYYARQYASNSRKAKNPYSEVKSVGLVEATRSMVASLEDEEEKKKKPINYQGTPTTSAALLHNKKSTQDIFEDDSMEEQRMRLKTQGKQLWCQLDLSGQGLVNISSKLFHYDFLESLYLSNNKLNSIPSSISKLRNLRTLDLSHNRINELPEELGLCFNLRYLFLFDNNIKTLPYSFGNMIELLFIGIEGNPLEPSIANLIAEKGTKELIATLRDQTTVKRTPKPRCWLTLEDDGEVVDSDEVYKVEPESSDNFTVLSYNTLCQHYATPKMYKFTPSWALQWDYRKNLLEKEVLNYNTDIVCMQEVETKTFQEFWLPVMTANGYKGYFFSKTRSKTMSETDSKKVDGCATFFKNDKFSLIHKQNFEYNSVCMGSDKYKKTKDLFNRFMNKDNIALISYLQHKESGEKIAVVNTHLHWDPAFNDVKALQVGILLEELQGIIKKYRHTNSNEDIKNSSIVVCGDFNSVKDSAVYQLFSTGASKGHEDMNGRDYGKFTEDGFHHPFKLKSAYEAVGELPFTNLTPAFTDNIDYIWYSTPTLQVKGLLGRVDEEYTSHSIGFPDANFPSDHVPILAKFQLKKGKKNHSV